MDAAAIAALVAEQVALALANHLATNDNNGRGPEIANSDNHSNTNNTGTHPRRCTYKEFMGCKPKTFHGDGGMVALTRWFEKMESVFDICACPEELKVKYAACTFADAALSWWNSEVKTMTLGVANAMSWNELKVMMVEVYCPRSEIQNMEQEFWAHTMKGSDLIGYTNRFNDLAVLCPSMVEPEYKKVERYIWGLSPEIQGMVTASRPTTFISAKTIAQRLVDQCIRKGTLEKKPEPSQGGNNKRKHWGNKKGKPQHTAPKKQQTVTVAAVTAPIVNAVVAPAPQKGYTGIHPKCNLCHYHHPGPCRECTKCGRKGHTADYCRQTAQPATRAANTGVARSCYECGDAGHFKRNCPKLVGGNGRVGRVLTMGAQEAREDPTVVTGTFLLNNSYASMLFDSGAERSFVSHKIKALLNLTPQKLNETFTVEMANGKTENTNEIYVGCTLTFGQHSFKIDLMPISISSFDVIIGMDWLSPHRAAILCYEKAVRLNLPNQDALLIYGDKPGAGLQSSILHQG